VDLLAFFAWGEKTPVGAQRDGHEFEYQFAYLGAVSGRERGDHVSQMRYVMRALAVGRRKYDLVIANHVALAPVARILKFVYGTPYWVVCHSIEVWWGASRARGAALRGAELVLPISEYTSRTVQKNFGVAPERMRVLYNAVPDGFVKLLDEAGGEGEELRHAGVDVIQESEKVILSVTTLVKGNEFKGIDTVIRALPKISTAIPRVRYVVVGEGEIRRDLETLARELGVAERVTFAGEVSDAELAEWYRRCDVFLLPSRGQEKNGEVGGEGFGRVYVEAALAERPVIASRTGGAAEAVLHGRTGLLVNPNSSDEVAEAAIALLRDTENAGRMGAEGRKWAMEMFSEAALVNSVGALLRDSQESARVVRTEVKMAREDAREDSADELVRARAGAGNSRDRSSVGGV
jgi:glycosyltransferase involved in cell wall biosynthesis